VEELRQKPAVSLLTRALLAFLGNSLEELFLQLGDLHIAGGIVVFGLAMGSPADLVCRPPLAFLTALEPPVATHRIRVAVALVLRTHLLELFWVGAPALFLEDKDRVPRLFDLGLATLVVEVLDLLQGIARPGDPYRLLDDPIEIDQDA